MNHVDRRRLFHRLFRGRSSGRRSRSGALLDGAQRFGEPRLGSRGRGSGRDGCSVELKWRERLKSFGISNTSNVSGAHTVRVLDIQGSPKRLQASSMKICKQQQENLKCTE